MNYGRFYRLNRTLSEIENGIAIYDYVDLPAYFTSSEDNHMSPKYPISVFISTSSIVFRLHYSAFKIEEKARIKDGTNNNYPYYTYDSDDLKIDKEEEYKVGDNVKVAHMEEVILELPFVDNDTSLLSDTIKDIYNTPFPQLIENTSTGGRFLEQLINKRYPKVGCQKKTRDIEEHLYELLRETSDNSPSYSTLWLMDLIKDFKGEKEKNNKRIELNNEKGQIIAFLRKLLLDFIFDLKHSDVFQNSVHYQKMYSGLMSDFYFSALMHKCEYYYYRKITSKAIEDNERVDKSLSKEENKKRIEKGKETIASLYANELTKAENLWIKDIMNPLAEKDFEHRYPGKHKILREFFEYYSFKQWPSWFAEPEEEMRRVCFTMKDKTGERHACNADTMARYLGLKGINSINYNINRSADDKNAVKKILDTIEDDKEKVSRWFLKHYAFSDVLHLHCFKHLNLLFILFFSFPALFSLFSRMKLEDVYSYIPEKLYSHPYIIIDIVLILGILFLSLLSNSIAKCKIRRKSRLIALYRLNINRIRKYRRVPKIISTRRWTIVFRIIIFLLIIASLYMLISYRSEGGELLKTCSPNLIFLIFGILVLIIALIPSFISCLHLFLPRLVASITLAWITLSMGFDLYVSYFDAKPRILYVVVICVIVLFFVIYSINLVIPHGPSLRKFLRSMELMIISYFISLSVGFVVINYLGEKYLERGGYISDFYTQHVSEDEDGTLEWTQYRKQNPKLAGVVLKDSNRIDTTYVILEKVRSIDKAINDTASHVRLVKDLEKVNKIKGKEDFVAAVINFWGIKLFVLRDFLIMFSFIAMFTGIFIQLIIFGDNKQMTEL